MEVETEVNGECDGSADDDERARSVEREGVGSKGVFFTMLLVMDIGTGTTEATGAAGACGGGCVGRTEGEEAMAVAVVVVTAAVVVVGVGVGVGVVVGECREDHCCCSLPLCSRGLKLLSLPFSRSHSRS